VVAEVLQKMEVPTELIMAETDIIVESQVLASLEVAEEAAELVLEAPVQADLEAVAEAALLQKVLADLEVETPVEVAVPEELYKVMEEPEVLV
jgi:hypothetical protein